MDDSVTLELTIAHMRRIRQWGGGTVGYTGLAPSQLALILGSILLRIGSVGVNWHGVFVYTAGSGSRTVVDLLESDNRVCRQIVLRILVEEEGLRRHGPLLMGWRRHGRVLVAWVHGCEAGRDSAAVAGLVALFSE